MSLDAPHLPNWRSAIERHVCRALERQVVTSRACCCCCFLSGGAILLDCPPLLLASFNVWQKRGDLLSLLLCPVCSSTPSASLGPSNSDWRAWMEARSLQFAWMLERRLELPLLDRARWSAETARAIWLHSLATAPLSHSCQRSRARASTQICTKL